MAEEMRDLAAARPPEFTRNVLPAEKKLLEGILETALGVSRKKPGPRNRPSKRAPAKKAPVKRPRKPPRILLTGGATG